MASRNMRAVISLAGKVDKSLSSAMRSVQKQAQGLQKSLAGMGSKVATGIAAGVGAASTAVAAVGAQALKSYASYEQMVGGVETLFGTGGKSLQEYAASVGQTVEQASAKYDQLMASQKAVMDSASSAWNTAGVSASSYMEQATMMSASLIQSLGGDTQAAASMVDLAIKDMADNANKFGTDLGSIQMTYQSLMRGNYAMLDNLKLGYGGTKTELERLVKDASELTGKALDPSKFSDVITAIHAVQDSLGITGTTAKEASTTIEGSVNSMRAAWENWLTGLGTDGADMGKLTGDLVASLGAVADNVGPAVQRIARSLASSLPSALSGALSAVGPIAAEAFAGIFNSVGGALDIGLPQIDASAILDTFSQIGSALAPMLSGIASTVRSVMPSIVSGFQGLVQSVGPAIQTLVDGIGPSLSAFVQSVLPPLMSALSGILPLLSSIATAILPPIISYITPLASMLMNLASAVIPMITSAVQFFTPVIQLVISAFLQLQPLISGVMGLFSSLGGIWMNISTAIVPQVQAGLQLLSGGFQTVSNIASIVVGVFQSVAGAISNIIGLAAQAASAVGSIFAGVGGAIGGLLGFRTGGFTTGPYIAGEDPSYPNEAVISFNPAYRAQNLRYWERAGHMLGVSPRVASETSGGSGGGATYDFSGLTFAPNVTVKGNASKDDIIAAIRECEAEFIDTIKAMLAQDEEGAYAAA